MSTRTAEHLLGALLDDARVELAQWDPRTLDRILDRLHQARSGYPTGHEPATPLVRFDPDTGDVIPFAQDRDQAKLTTHSDRTGEAVIAAHRDDATATHRRLLRAARDLEHATTRLRQIRQRWGTLMLLECCQAHLQVGIREPVARGVYQRYCRSCGEDVARNDGHMTPKAIMEAIAARQAISDQLIAAHPLPNGKPWKRRKPRTRPAK